MIDTIVQLIHRFELNAWKVVGLLGAALFGCRWLVQAAASRRAGRSSEPRRVQSPELELELEPESELAAVLDAGSLVLVDEELSPSLVDEVDEELLEDEDEDDRLSFL